MNFQRLKGSSTAIQLSELYIWPATCGGGVRGARDAKIVVTSMILAEAREPVPALKNTA